MRPAEIWAQLFDVGKDILVAAIDKVTGVITVQTGNATDLTADQDAAELWGPPGYYGLPANPTPGQASCQAVTMRAGDHDMVIGTRDTRDSSVYGNMKPGDRAICAGYPAQNQVLLKASDGSINLLTTDDNTANGNTVQLRLAPLERRFWSTWGQELHDPTGWHLRTWHGGSIDVTGLGLPAPLSSLGLKSVINLSADCINLDASLLSLGRNNGGNAQPVVQATPLQGVMAVVGTAITSIGAAADAISAVAALLSASPSGGPVTAAPGLPAAIIAMTTAVSTMNTAVGNIATPLATISATSPTGCATTTSMA